VLPSAKKRQPAREHLDHDPEAGFAIDSFRRNLLEDLALLMWKSERLTRILHGKR
jgi:hypothetical protein